MAATRRTLSVELDRRVRQIAQNRCGYCLSPQYLVMARLEIEHVLPLAKGGTNEESSLWLASPLCTGHKSDKIEGRDPETGHIVPLFHPGKQVWYDHFLWTEGGLRIVGRTPT